MAAIDKAKKPEMDLLKKVIGEHHEPLLEHKVTFVILMAYGKRNEEDELLTNALKDRGHPIAVKTKVNSLADRAAGQKDGMIILDGDHWKGLGAEAQFAVMDHALATFELQETVEGDVKYDDLGRPKLRKVHGDMRVAGFSAVAARNGAQSLEVKAVVGIQNLEQLQFAFKQAA